VPAFGPPSIAQGAFLSLVASHMEQTGAGRGKKTGKQENILVPLEIKGRFTRHSRGADQPSRQSAGK